MGPGLLGHLSAAGGDYVGITGENFGPSAAYNEPLLEYRNSHGLRFVSLPCNVTTFTSMLCQTAGGSGHSLQFRVHVGSQLSQWLNTSLQFQVPVIASVLALPLNTSGGEVIRIEGSGIGRPGTPLLMEYGVNASGIHARRCRVATISRRRACSSYHQCVIEDGPVSLWRCSEASGVSLIDSFTDTTALCADCSWKAPSLLPTSADSAVVLPSASAVVLSNMSLRCVNPVLLVLQPVADVCLVVTFAVHTLGTAWSSGSLCRPATPAAALFCKMQPRFMLSLLDYFMSSLSLPR
jgi:hypothetical protein